MPQHILRAAERKNCPGPGEEIKGKEKANRKKKLAIVGKMPRKRRKNSSLREPKHFDSVSIALVFGGSPAPPGGKVAKEAMEAEGLASPRRGTRTGMKAAGGRPGFQEIQKIRKNQRKKKLLQK